MSDPDHDRLQKYIDEQEHALAQVRERLAVLENDVRGNGRPGLIQLIKDSTGALEGISERLASIEHQNKYVKMRNNDLWAKVRNIIYVLTFAASIAFNIYFAIVG